MNVNNPNLSYINITSENISFDLKSAFKLSYSISQAIVACPNFGNGKSKLQFHLKLIKMKSSFDIFLFQESSPCSLAELCKRKIPTIINLNEY